MNKEQETQTTINRILELSQYLCNSKELSENDYKYASYIKSTTVYLQSLVCETTTTINTEENSAKKVLLVEDNIMNQEVMSLIFEDLEMDFAVASHGKEALDIYTENYNEFSLILMDINMPIMNGIEAFIAIREYEKENNLSNIPIIALTANAIKGDKEKFLDLGMDGYISKPINTNELKNIFDTFISSNTIKKEEIEPLKKELSSNKELIIDPTLVASKLGIGENIASLIINKFKTDIKNDLEELWRFIEINSIENISQKAHYIKNSCLNVALDEVCDILQELENRNLTENKKKELFTELSKLLKNIK